MPETEQRTVRIRPLKVRGVTFLGNGQRFEGYLPPGWYEVAGLALLPGGVLDPGQKGARRLVKQGGSAETWFVGVDVVLS